MNETADLGWAWHPHHASWLPCEPLTEPLEVRAEYIRDYKPLHEIAERLRRLQPVRGPLPPRLVEAGRAADEARRAYEVGRAYEARRVYGEAQRACEAEVLALHAQECPDCPWEPTQRTLFPT